MLEHGHGGKKDVQLNGSCIYTRIERVEFGVIEMMKLRLP